MNSVNIIATLKEVDKNNPSIRYCIIKKPYAVFDNKIEGDIIPLVNWNKESQGELFSLVEGSLVAIKGRIETYNDKTVIVCETLLFLGLKG